MLFRSGGGGSVVVTVLYKFTGKSQKHHPLVSPVALFLAAFIYFMFYSLICFCYCLLICFHVYWRRRWRCCGRGGRRSGSRSASTEQNQTSQKQVAQHHVSTTHKFEEKHIRQRIKLANNKSHNIMPRQNILSKSKNRNVRQLGLSASTHVFESGHVLGTYALKCFD